MAEETTLKHPAVYTPDMEWQDLNDFPGNAKAKLLREEGKAGAKTMLVRLAVGSEVAEHAHTAAIQHFVVEGEYESGGKTYRAGTYRFIPAHETSAPITTRGGCTILMIYDPVCA